MPRSSADRPRCDWSDTFGCGWLIFEALSWIACLGCSVSSVVTYFTVAATLLMILR